MALALVPAGMNPRSVAVDPSGRYAYVANGASNDVSQYAIGVDGSLVLMASATVAAGNDPTPPTAGASGIFGFVLNLGSGKPSQLSPGPHRAVTPMTPPPPA